MATKLDFEQVIKHVYDEDTNTLRGTIVEPLSVLYPTTKLDYQQVIKAVYDESTQTLRMSSDGGGGGGTITSVNGDVGPDVQLDAVDIPYDNTVSGLTATEVQGAIDELAAAGGAVDSVNGQTGIVQLDAIDIPYDNIVSGLLATEVQAAIDELATSSGGANTTLSNLDSPTSINEDLLPNSDDSINIGSDSLKYATGNFTPASLGIGTGLTPDFWGADLSGLIIDGTTTYASTAGGAGIVYKGGDSSFIIASQDRNDTAKSADIYMVTGVNTGGGGSGSHTIETGAVNGVSEYSGNISINTGSNGSGQSGGVYVNIGSASPPTDRGEFGASAGSIVLDADGPGGILIRSTGSGDIQLLTDTSDIVMGVKTGDAIKLKSNDGISAPSLSFYNAASTFSASIKAPALSANYTLTLPVDDGTPSQVLTTNGSGVLSWTTPGSSGANTTLSNLTSPVSFNQNLLPDTTGTKILGSSSLRMAEVHSSSVYVYSDLRISTSVGTLQGQLQTGATAPSGTVSFGMRNVVAGQNLLVFTNNSSGTTVSGDIRLESGNSVDGNSGSVILRPGVPTGTGIKGTIDVTNSYIINALNPVNPQDVATKDYVDNTNYIPSIAINASQTNAVISSFTYDSAAFEGLEIVYKLIFNDAVKTGRILVASNGVIETDCNDSYVHAGTDPLVSFDSQINGTDIEITYTTGAGTAGTMRAYIKKFIA